MTTSIGYEGSTSQPGSHFEAVTAAASWLVAVSTYERQVPRPNIPYSDAVLGTLAFLEGQIQRSKPDTAMLLASLEQAAQAEIDQRGLSPDSEAAAAIRANQFYALAGVMKDYAD